MNILVTGYTGFSGNIIANFLSSIGHVVYAVVRRRALPINYNNKNIKLIEADISSTDLFPQTIDAVVHAAAISPAPGVSFKDYFDTNVLGINNLVNYAKRSGAHSFIFLSSLSVYGDIALDLVNPDTVICNPNQYGLSKLMGELIIKDSISNFRSVSIRLPGIIGPKSVRNWLTNCRDSARSNKPITIYNPNSLFNNAVYINDLSFFILKLLNNNWSGAHSVTVGASDAISVIDVIESIISGTNSKSKIIIKSSSKKSFLICNEKAIQYGYSPMSIQSMVESFVKDE
jgi:nucleoside-diphosphate-sugar epimerase